MGAAFQPLGNPLSPLTEEPRSKEARIEHEEAVPSLKLQAGALKIPPLCTRARCSACFEGDAFSSLDPSCWKCCEPGVLGGCSWCSSKGKYYQLLNRGDLRRHARGFACRCAGACCEIHRWNVSGELLRFCRKRLKKKKVENKHGVALTASSMRDL